MPSAGVRELLAPRRRTRLSEAVADRLRQAKQ